MTTAQESSRNRLRAWVTAAIAVLACTQVSAHRRDEYLQAARIAIEPARLDVELDLTPGIALAPSLIREIDRNHDGDVTGDEAGAFAVRVLGEISLEVDGRPMPLELAGRQFPTVSAMLRGEGTIQILVAISVPPLEAGGHRIRYRNDHHPEMAVYLANALAPRSERISVQAQRRSEDQRDIVIEYVLDGARASKPVWWSVPGLAAVLCMVGAVWFRANRYDACRLLGSSWRSHARTIHDPESAEGPRASSVSVHRGRRIRP
jgi:nickel/cobalt transporter (NicO) family protein